MTEKPQLDPERQVQARRYARLQRRWMLLEMLGGGIYLTLWTTTGLARALQGALQAGRFLGRLPSAHWGVELLLFAAALALPWIMLTFPLGYYTGYILPHRFDLSTQTLRGWLSDRLKGGALSATLAVPLLLGLYALLRALPGSWWLPAACAYSLVSVVLTALAPVLLMPLFYRFIPLEDSHRDLAQRLQALAGRCGVQVRGVYSIDMSRRTVAANAALVGLGRTRRIVLGDTLLENFTPQEIETVLAHELGHHVHHDIPLGILIESGLNFGLFFLAAKALAWAGGRMALASTAAPAGLPLLVLLFALFGLLLMPLTNGYSRWRECLADRFALRLTGLPQAFAAAMTRLANQNLADADPPRWVLLLFASHPPLRERIAAAERFAGTRPDQ